MWLFEPDRFFFYITNDRTTPASEIVFLANDRCDQENLIGQLKGGVKAMAMPVGDLVSNGAYMVMASLAWSLKAWAALLLPERRPLGGVSIGRRSVRCLRMEFSTFCAAMVQVPCQVVTDVPVGSCTDCCRGTRGRECSFDWWSGCTVGGCVERRLM